MKAELLLTVGGVFHVAFAAFHLLFWRLFRWKEELAKLTSLNRAVVQVLNLCLTFVFLVFAYVSFFNAGELLTTGLGKSLLMLIAILWYLRAVEQIWFFGLRKPLSLLLFVIFVIGGSLYAACLL